MLICNVARSSGWGNKASRAKKPLCEPSRSSGGGHCGMVLTIAFQRFLRVVYCELPLSRQTPMWYSSHLRALLVV
jgi:hypothetical protein